MAALMDLDSVPFQEAYWEFRVAYDEAELDPESYWRSVARAAGRNLNAHQIGQLRRMDIQSWVQPNLAMVAWARLVREGGLKTAVLSNMPADLLAYLVGPESWLPDFDQVTFSCEIHCSKPAPEIYRHCLDQLGVTASEALFIDDREPNIEGARKVGMHGLLFTDVAGAIKGLHGRYALPALVPSE
ncbi:MAG: HAD family phosphatase [Acidobacteriota bacterium]|nr:HAD family phosphatase [Acidobacteriota bacterium]